MRKDTTTAKLTEYEIERNKQIAQNSYIACPAAYLSTYSRLIENGAKL